MSSVLQQMAVQVLSIGEDVTIQIGNCEWRVGFEAALHLSAVMRSAAAVAKRIAGDTSRTYRVSGTLHDAEKGPDAGQPHNPFNVPVVSRVVLKREQLDARAEGVLVVVKLGSTEAKMPYGAVFTIAQWVRLRAKESKLRAGDTKRHWSEIVRQQAMN